MGVGLEVQRPQWLGQVEKTEAVFCPNYIFSSFPHLSTTVQNTQLAFLRMWLAVSTLTASLWPSRKEATIRSPASEVEEPLRLWFQVPCREAADGSQCYYSAKPQCPSALPSWEGPYLWAVFTSNMIWFCRSLDKKSGTFVTGWWWFVFGFKKWNLD